MRRSFFVALSVAAVAIVLALPPSYAGSTNGTYVTLGIDRHAPDMLDLMLAPSVVPMYAQAEKAQLVKQDPISAAYVAAGSGSALPPGVAASVVLREREPVPYHRLL